jgi:uncharacterized cupin superfamily protein
MSDTIDDDPRLGTPAEPWFIANATEAPWSATPGWGRSVAFEPQGTRFRDFGLNIHVLEPGERSTMYHGEDGQEDFLVLSGSCTLVIEGEVRTLRAWDFLHCPAWTRHAFANEGDEPCALLMVGARRDGADVPCEYPVEAEAQRRGAGVDTYTTESDAAYAGTPEDVVEAYRRGTLPGA